MNNLKNDKRSRLLRIHPERQTRQNSSPNLSDSSAFSFCITLLTHDFIFHSSSYLPYKCHFLIAYGL